MPATNAHTAYTVGELARLSGVSVRTLHHYDAVGLLTPDHVGENGYRSYGRAELLRLQQILFHRQLGLSLRDIAVILDAPGFDQLSALSRHRARLVRTRADLAQLIRTIDVSIAALQGTTTMKDADLYKGLTAEKQAEYEAYLLSTYGEPIRDTLEQSRDLRTGRSSADHESRMGRFEAIRASLADAFRAGTDARSADLDPVLHLHHAWIAEEWGRQPVAEAYAGLGNLYASHEDFRRLFEDSGTNFADWLKDAMEAFAARNL